ncbi:MAG: alcohol dehydrogenase catalytic domain-containing protein, partial [Burkholderiales bacterium]
MRAVAVTEFGGPEKLALIDAPVPRPAAGEALVKLEYAGLNFIDIYMRSGEYARSQTYKTPLPMVVGMEGIGTLSTGERVAYCITRGSYAEYAAVPAWKL